MAFTGVAWCERSKVTSRKGANRWSTMRAIRVRAIRLVYEPQGCKLPWYKMAAQHASARGGFSDFSKLEFLTQISLSWNF